MLAKKPCSGDDQGNLVDQNTLDFHLMDEQTLPPAVRITISYS
ncbi:hypothetical protein OH492_16165 [Vibrio chagasii]|nr:hypothetical protein [Vibrio chagasii]